MDRNEQNFRAITDYKLDVQIPLNNRNSDVWGSEGTAPRIVSLGT
jgi:hypothetical protein